MKYVLKNALAGCLLVFGFAFLSLVSFVALILFLGSFGHHTTHTTPATPAMNKAPTPTPAPAPVTNEQTYEPPKREHDPALDKKLMDALDAAKSGKKQDQSTPKDEYIEPSVREFGDASGNSWIDPSTFTSDDRPLGKPDPTKKK